MKLALSLLLAVLSLASAAGQVGPVPGTQRIIPVYDQADVVCLCRIESVVITPGQPAADFAESKIVQRGVAMTVEAKQIFKSDRPNAQQFLVKYTEEVGVTSPPKTILERGDIALLFLKAISPTTYQLGDRFLGVTRFTALPGAAGTKGLGGLETCLVSLVRHENKDDRLNGLRLLQGFDSLSQSS